MHRTYRNKTEAMVTRIFLLVEIVVYLSFLYLDLFYQAGPSVVLKFFSIFVCLLYILFLCGIEVKRCKKNNKDRLLLLAALSFTVLADICLLLMEHYFYGVCFFILVQEIYLLRFGRGWKYVKYVLIRRIVVGLLLAAVLVFFLKTGEGLIFAVSFYFVSFVDNLMILIKKANYNFNHTLFLTGMLLFFLCDINVGFYNLGIYIQNHNGILERIVNFSEIGMWLFYLPGQVLISLSSTWIKDFS